MSAWLLAHDYLVLAALVALFVAFAVAACGPWWRRRHRPPLRPARPAQPTRRSLR